MRQQKMYCVVAKKRPRIELNEIYPDKSVKYNKKTHKLVEIIKIITK